MALQPERKKSRSLSLASIAQISNDISRKFLDRSDLARLLRIVSTTYKDQTPVLEVLDAFFISNPQAKIKLVFVDDTVYVKNIFIMSPAMQELAQNFPEHLYVDLLSNIRPGFNLYSVSCEVNSGWKMCASCISKANNPETLRFLIVSVLQSIPKIKGQIKTITVHPGIEDRLYLGMLLPNVILKHSILLLEQALDGRMSNLDSATKSQIKIALNVMLNTRSLKVYNRQLDNFKAVCPAEIFQYYFENWHSIRKLWFSKEQKHQLKTEQAIYTYVTSLHYTLATEMGVSPSLKACLHVVLNDNLELKSGPDISSLPEPLPVVVPEQPTSPHSIVSEEVQQTHEERETNGLEHMEFSSWDEFQLFFTRWCVEQKIMFIIRTSVPLNDDNMSQELIQSLKFNTVSLGCSTYTRKRCPALIQLTLGPEKDKLIITKADLNHIHDSEIDLPSRFTRKPISFVEVPATLSNGVSDKFMDRNDLTKLLRLSFPFGGESQLLDELESLFNSDPTAKVKFIYTEDKLIVKYIFVMTTIMQNLLHHFPEHIYVDYLSGLNQEFDLYSVLCQDENFSWKVCTLCVTRKELSESLRFLLTSVLHSLPNLSSQVKYVTLSPEIQNIACIEALFPNASVRYCLPLILDCMYRKISFLSQMEQFQIKNLLLNLAQASSMDVYRLYLVELKAACPDEVFQYYFDTWHPCWKLWAEKDSRVSAVENTVFTYVESKHQDIKSQVGAMPSLHQCLQVILVEDLHQYLQVILVEDQTKDQLCETNHSADLDESNSSAWKSSNTASVEFQEEQGPPPLEDCSTSVLQKDCEEVENDQLNGKEFQSWDEFCAYLETWSKEKYLVRQSSALTENSNCENPAVLDMVSSFKYSWVQLFCNRKDCSSFIELTLSPQKEKLVITQSNLNHNHDVEETTLPPPAKKCKLSTAVGLPAQVANNISRKFLEPSDLRRLLRFRSGAFEDRTQVLAELEKLFIADPQAKVKLVFVEDKLLVNKILLMTSAMKEVAHKFHEHLFIDIFSEFSQSFDLYSIFCEEKGVGWNVCAYCIAKKGVEGILDFLISSVVQIIPTLNGQVKHITLHPEISETVQLEPHLQHVTTRYCMHLLLDVLYNRVSHLDTTVAAQIKNYLHILSQTCSLKVYDRYLNDLKAICPADIFQYYYDTWHPRRKMWAKKDNKVEESEKKIFELVTQNHEKLKSTLGPVPSLHQCLCAVLGDSHKTSGNKSYLQEANMTQFCHLEESSAISPLNEQAQECELPLLDDDEGAEHKETSTNQLQELPTSIDNRENSTVPSSDSCNTVKQEGDCISPDINGMKFNSWRQFCEYFDHLCEMKKTAYKIISAIHFAKTHDKAEVFKFQHVQLGCQIFHNEPSNEICAVREYVPNSCPAKLTLQFSMDENCLVVSEAKLQHNHKAEHQKFDVPFRYYSLTSYTELYLLVNSFAGRFIKPQEVSLLLKWKHSLNKTVLDLLKILKALFLEDSMSIVKLDISPETMQLECVFIMTSKMKYLLECFPSFLFLGKPLSVNESYDLYTAMCEDNKKNSRECAYFITLKERPTPFPDLLVFLIQSIPNLKICVKDLLLQIDLKELQLVRELLPSCRVRISQTHALNALYHHVKESDPITQEKLKGLMYSLVNCCSPDLYNTYFTELETSSSDNFLQYFLQTWHSCKNDWCHGMKEGHFLECAAQQKEMLTTLAQSPVSPAVCIQALIKNKGVNSEDNPDEQPMEISVSNEQSAGCEINSSHCVTSDSTSPVSMCGILIKEERPVKQLHLKGKIFQSWDMFCEFFDQYCKENKCLYKIAKVTRFINIEEADLHHFRYQQAVLLCKGTGEQHQPRLNFSTMQLPCSASITVQFSTENHCLVISQEHLQHNHVLDPHAFDTCFSHCSLTSRPQFAALITNIANCFITPHHIKELMKWSNALEPNLCDFLKELEILLSDDAMVKMKLVFCPETFCLESVFIMTSQAMNLLENFPSMLFLGHSLMLNESFDLYTVLCEDNESNGRECAYFITHKESTKPVLQMVVCLTQSIPEIIERIEVIVLRVDLKELDQIQDLLPSCCVRMSQAHALDVLYHQIREEDPRTKETLKKLMYNLVHSQTSSIYNSYFDELKSMASENFLHYFEHTWHIRKEDWAECWSHKMKDGNFLEFSQWQPNDLRPMLNFPSSLATCIRALLNLVRAYNMQCSKTNSSQDITTKEAEHHSQTPAVLEKSLLTLESLDVTKKQEESLDVTKKQETEHHSQSPAILDNSSLALEILDVQVQKQEVSELNINTHSEATESNNDNTLQPQAEVPTAKVLDDVRNGINSIESHATQDIPSTSSTHDTSDEIINEERPFNCRSLEGRVFLSWIEFRNFFDRWCERNMALYKVKCCRPLCRTDTFITPAAKMITVLKYSFLYLVCKYSTVSHSSMTDSSGELSSPCQSCIIVQAGPCNDRLIITHAELDHNHKIMEEEFDRCFPRFMLKGKPFQFLEMTKSVSKQFLTLKDLQALVDRSCNEEPSIRDLLHELNCVCCQDPKVKIKLVFYPDIVEVDCCFIMTYSMRRMLESFPSLLYIDRSPTINEDFDLYTAHIEDANNRGRACAYLITRKESQTPVRFMMVSLLQSISNTVKSKITTVVLHAGFEELDLVKSFLRKRTVKMSQAYALEALHGRVEQEAQSVHKAIKSIISRIVLSNSPEEYQSNLRELEAIALTDFFQYFLQNWHSFKETWVAYWSLPEPQRTRFPNHIRIYHQNLQSTFCLPTSLAQCVSGLLELQSLKALTTTLDEHMISLFFQELCQPDVLKLVQEEIVLTKQGLYEIKEVDKGFMLNDGTSDFLLNQDITKCSCSIFKSSSLPCRHIFATRLWIGEAILDVKLLQVNQSKV